MVARKIIRNVYKDLEKKVFCGEPFFVFDDFDDKIKIRKLRNPGIETYISREIFFEDTYADKKKGKIKRFEYLGY